MQAKRPGVLVCHEWWGLNDYIRGRARQIAQLSYVAFALDMFGEGKSVTDHADAAKLMNALITNPDAMGRVKAAFDVLTKQPQCDTGKLASIGYCMGGSMSLHMARAGLPVRGVAAFHGNLQSKGHTSKGPVAAKILACVGADDPMIPPADVADFEDEMRRSQADYQIIIYGNARHAFTNPNADKAGLPPLKYDANADRRSWAAMVQFLQEVFA
jgi:dienelactone hydrolase